MTSPIDQAIAALENVINPANMSHWSHDVIRDALAALKAEREKKDEAARKIWEQAMEKAAKIAENIFGGRAHTYASENSERYIAQDETCELIAKRIRASLPEAPAMTSLDPAVQAIVERAEQALKFNSDADYENLGAFVVRNIEALKF